MGWFYATIKTVKGGISKVAKTFRFFTAQVCCTEVSVLECFQGSDPSDFRIIRSFSLPLDEVYLWKPKIPLYLSSPSNLFFLKQVDLLCPQGVDYDLAVRFEFDKNVPFPKHLVYWAYDLLSITTNEMEFPAIILGGRIDVVDKWLGRLPFPLSNAQGLSANILSFYALFRYWETIKEIREKDKVVLGILCDVNYTDVIILGEDPSKDWLRTFPRPYGNISLIWDIKETLEAYFAKMGPSIGTVPLTKEIASVYIVRLGDVEEEREWENVFTEQIGVGIEELPVHEILGDYLPVEKANKFSLVFGLAMMLAKNKFMVPGVVLELDVSRQISSVSFMHVLVQLGLLTALVGGGGFFYFRELNPLLYRKAELVKLAQEYEALSRKVKRWERRKELLLTKEKKLSSYVRLQYSWPEIITALANALGNSDGIRVNGLSGKVTQGKRDFISFSVQLSAKDYDSLNNFLSNIRSLGWFNRISPVSSNYDEKKDKVEMLLVVEKWLSEQ